MHDVEASAARPLSATARPLDGVTVLSFEQAVAAPFATRQLADLGARVIKVERPGGGDFARGYDGAVNGLSAYFAWLNRSKESLTLDLAGELAGEVLERLLPCVDVVVHNLGPGVAERFGLDASALRGRFPALVVCAISGYGPGPLRRRKAYDLLIQAEAGLVSVTGTEDEPAKVGISVADIAGGMYAYSGILGALYARERSGEGASLDVSLFDALVEWMAHPLYVARYTGRAPRRSGRRHATIAPYGPFATAGGGSLVIAVQNAAEWERLCAAVLDAPALARDSRFADNPSRVANRGELEAAIAERVRAWTRAELSARLDAASIAWGTVTPVEELPGHPALRERWTTVDSPVGPIDALPPPVRVSGVAARMDAIPAAGEHTGAILAELGLDPPERTAP